MVARDTMVVWALVLALVLALALALAFRAASVATARVVVCVRGQWREKQAMEKARKQRLEKGGDKKVTVAGTDCDSNGASTRVKACPNPSCRAPTVKLSGCMYMRCPRCQVRTAHFTSCVARVSVC